MQAHAAGCCPLATALSVPSLCTTTYVTAFLTGITALAIYKEHCTAYIRALTATSYTQLPDLRDAVSDEKTISLPGAWQFSAQDSSTGSSRAPHSASHLVGCVSYPLKTLHSFVSQPTWPGPILTCPQP